MHHVNRRQFLRNTACSFASLGVLATAASAVEPFKRAGAPRLLLSLAGYSFRDYFIHGNRSGKSEGASRRQIDLFQFIDYCAEQGCAGAEPTSYYFPPEVNDEFLLKLRRHAFLRGIAISGTAVGNNFALPKGPKRDAEIASVKKWITHASVLGAPHIRIFAGAAQGVGKDEAKQLCIAAIEECAAEAGKHGIFLGIENHGGIVAEPEDLLDIVRRVNSPWVGVNLDTGNFNTDDPYRDLASCAPYTVNAQVKAEIRRRGQKAEPADFQRLVQILREANYQGYVALEYESKEDPWTAVPRLLKELKDLMPA